MSGRVARAYWTVGEGLGELRSEALPEPGPGQVLVEALFSGVSRGTELLVHRGRVPTSEFARMRAPYQVGEFPWPVKYGYCSVGRVTGGTSEWLGRSVFCLHPHQTSYVMDASAVVALPSVCPASRAVLAANMETALNAIWDAELKAGDRVSVVGAGVVGCLIAYLAARHPGTEVELIDVDGSKATIAAALGIRFALPDAARGACDRVVHASATAEGLNTALALAGPEATVLEVSWYGDQPVTLPLGAAFHALRLRLQSSQVGTLPAAQQRRWTHRRRLSLALELLSDARLDALIDSEAPFEQLPQVMTELAGGKRRALCHRVHYSAAAQ